MKKQSGVICAIIAGLLTMSTAPVSGEDYPAKPIRIIVPTAAGGLTDLLARTFGQYVSDETKQAVGV